MSLEDLGHGEQKLLIDDCVDDVRATLQERQQQLQAISWQRILVLKDEMILGQQVVINYLSQTNK